MTDPLSDVLRSVRLTGGVFLDAKFTAPWCVAAQVTPQQCKPFLPALVQVIAYHVVLEGSMIVALDGEPPIELRAGEIILLPRNDIHTMASGAGVAPVNATGLMQQSPDGGLLNIRYGGGNEPTSLICGFLGTQELFQSLACHAATNPASRHQQGRVARLDRDLGAICGSRADAWPAGIIGRDVEALGGAAGGSRARVHRDAR